MYLELEMKFQETLYDTVKNITLFTQRKKMLKKPL